MPVPDRELARVVRDAIARLHLSYIDVAALAAISIPLAHALCRRGRLPVQPRCLEGLRRFAERAREASARADLGLP